MEGLGVKPCLSPELCSWQRLGKTSKGPFSSQLPGAANSSDSHLVLALPLLSRFRVLRIYFTAMSEGTETQQTQVVPSGMCWAPGTRLALPGKQV